MPAAPAPAERLPIVAVGASAGGLEACRRLLDALPAPTGCAFILVQHLDPSHESLLVELLVPHTSLKVLQAADGMPVEAEHLYVIPPGSALAVRGGRLRLSAPTERHGARLPFDFLLQSVAAECGPRAMAVVLSGTGQDGSQGILAVRARDGCVLVQDPKEAGFDGMPAAAITTGAVNAVLPVAEIPEALLRHAAAPPEDNHLRPLIELLKRGTSHDFTLYKPGTLRRRTERRMGLAGFANMAEYLASLRRDPAELNRLAKDLLIHVTGFFRDPAVFELLGARILPELIAGMKPACRSASGSPAAARARRPGRWRSSARKPSRRAGGTSACRSSPPMSSRSPSPPPGRRSTPPPCSKGSRPGGATASSSARTAIGACARNCARGWSSRCRTCWRIRPSRGST